MKTPELFGTVVGVNFKVPCQLGALVGRRMAHGEGGFVINVSSSGALMPQLRFGPCAGAKAALNVLADVSQSQSEEERRRTRSARGHPGRPEAIVTSALYLASPASICTTGALLCVDGGLL